MSGRALRVHVVSKRYRIGQHLSNRTLREAIVEAVGAPLRMRKELREPSGGERTIWALRDIDFDVDPGEVVGVVGRNGAGKSTLLKILTRITEPTRGRVEIRGRVASLLEVGTGFHSELTGRENIFLNGAILGMPRREVVRKFDDIVSFAELEQFIDTPVKRYSTGMYLRLAFAVAAHLEPDVLLVDEVLAVGDAQFQKRCLGRMGQVSREGRTVLLVSHQLAAIQSLCTRAIRLHGGVLVQDGPAGIVIQDYLSQEHLERSPIREWSCTDEAPGNSQLRLRSMRVTSDGRQTESAFYSSGPIVVEMAFDLATLHSSLCVGFDLINQDGVTVFRTSHNDRHEREWPRLRIGRNCLSCVIPAGLLNAGSYSVAPKIHLHGIAWIVNVEACINFDVHLDHSESAFWSVVNPHKHPGVLAPCLQWRGHDAIDYGRPAAVPRGKRPKVGTTGDVGR